MKTTSFADSGFLPQGAFPTPEGVRYVTWAHGHRDVRVDVQTDHGSRTVRLQPVGDEGYFATLDPHGRAGDRYTYSLDEESGVPDFASRYQPNGIHGPSMVVSSDFPWATTSWNRPAWKGQVVYELHIGTFTQEGTFRSAIARLDHLRDLGATCLEVMPVAERAGTKNWGYDGVFLFAPAHSYGTPDDFRAFVDAAHARGLAVMLDIVFNHLGPQGNVAPTFAQAYFHSDSETPWGRNFDLDGLNSGPVRALLKQNIRYWLDEFRIDGFRFDATHAIPDRSKLHLLSEISSLVHRHGGFVVAEDERNAVEVLEDSDRKGWNFDAAWADDFHHGIRVSQDPSRDRYYLAFEGTAAEIAETIEHGWLYRGQPFPPAKIARGTECRHLAPEKFVYCISNHDQIGNRPFADRFHHAISPDAYRAVSLFFCLLPYTPMLFMGQEWAASTPFHFFTDFEGELGTKMADYRRQEFERLGLEVPPGQETKVVDPQADAAFHNSKLRWDEVGQEPHRGTLDFYRKALSLRKELHVGGNLERTRWHVCAQDGVVLLRYLLSGRTVEIHFGVKSSLDVKLPASRILFRSALAGGSPDQPETIVVEFDRPCT